MNTRRMRAVWMAAMSAAAAACGDDDGGGADRLHRYADPSHYGPYPIGNLTLVLEDSDRPEPLTPEEDHRTLLTEIWYPASEEAREREHDRFTGFLGDQAEVFGPLLATALGGTEEDVERVMTLVTDSVRDAPIAEDGPFPVVLFSHGNTGIRFQSIFLCQHLASHGYIVVSADHTGNAAATLIPGRPPMLYNPSTFTADYLAEYRVGDMRFLLDVMEQLDGGDPDGRFTGNVDLANVGLTGHSYGGLTTMATLEADSRIDVGAPMAGPGALLGEFPESYGKPVMSFLATEDATIDLTGNAMIRADYDKSTGPRWLIEVADAGHFSFSDMCLLNADYGDGCGTGTRITNGEELSYLHHDEVHAITNYYQAALYGFFLKGVEAYRTELTSNPFPAGEVALEFDGIP